MESVKLPGVKKTAEEAAQDAGQQTGTDADAGAVAVPAVTQAGLVEGAVAPLPSSAAPGALSQRFAGSRA